MAGSLESLGRESCRDISGHLVEAEGRRHRDAGVGGAIAVALDELLDERALSGGVDVVDSGADGGFGRGVPEVEEGTYACDHRPDVLERPDEGVYVAGRHHPHLRRPRLRGERLELGRVAARR